jgi:ABC-type phosphonate transport system ATPase subunit
MSESPLLQVRNIETFYGPVMAIRGISLDVHGGKSLVFWEEMAPEKLQF